MGVLQYYDTETKRTYFRLVAAVSVEARVTLAHVRTRTFAEHANGVTQRCNIYFVGVSVSCMYNKYACIYMHTCFNRLRKITVYF